MPIAVPIFIFGLASLWDGCTTVYGTVRALGEVSFFSIFSAFIVAAIVLVMLFYTKTIIFAANQAKHLPFKLMWLACFAYDIYTSFLGNQDLILGQSTEQSLIVLIGMTILVSSSPVMVSVCLPEKWN